MEEESQAARVSGLGEKRARPDRGRRRAQNPLPPIWLSWPETARRDPGNGYPAILNWAKAAGYRIRDNPWTASAKASPDRAKNAVISSAIPYADAPDFVAEARRRPDERIRSSLDLNF